MPGRGTSRPLERHGQVRQPPASVDWSWIAVPYKVHGFKYIDPVSLPPSPPLAHVPCRCVSHMFVPRDDTTLEDFCRALALRHISDHAENKNQTNGRRRNYSITDL